MFENVYNKMLENVIPLHHAMFELQYELFLNTKASVHHTLKQNIFTA